jgi:hypothetical protein
MTIFDLIFIGVFFVTVVMLIATLVTVVRGRRRPALVVLLALIGFVTVYLVVVVFVSLLSPAHEVHLRQPQCFDDWCISVQEVERTVAGADAFYTTELHLFSRARGRPQRENGVSVYLLDEHGRRYEPAADPQAIPLNVLLNPGQSIIVSRTFILPAEVHDPGLVVAHSRVPGIFIIGDAESLFHKPTVVRFQ